MKRFSAPFTHTDKTVFSHAAEWLVAIIPVLIWAVFMFGARVITLCALCALFSVGFDYPIRRFVLNREGIAQFDPMAGIYGVLTRSEFYAGEQAMEVAERTELKEGPATILSCVEGDDAQEYDVQIVKVYRDGGGRDLLLEVTDPDLLAVTGGIVQGMSGSPIIQNGKLVGAVTHVLVNDPTRGYGIIIENMLEAVG